MSKLVNRYTFALLSVIMVCLLAFPTIADYTGDHTLSVYEHNTINGGVVFDTVVDGSKYTLLYSPLPNMTKPVLSQDLTVAIPANATVRTARLYNYYTWSDSGDVDNLIPGEPAEAILTISDGVNTWTTEVNNSAANPDVAHYVDRKGQGYTSKKYDYPSGTLAWDVTDHVAGSGTFTATIENARDLTNSTNNWTLPNPGEYFCTYGFGLLVVYELDDGSRIEYWIAEGCDMLYASGYYGVTPEMATTSATFSDGASCAASAELTTVLTASDKGIYDKNMVIFNDVEVGPSTALSKYAIGVNTFDVIDLLSGQNIVELQDRKDYETACNVFLVVNKDKRDMVVKIDSDLHALRTDVQDLDHAGIRTSLLSKIDNAIAKNDLALDCIDAGDEACANTNLNTCKSTMNAFISQVDAQSDIHIPVDTADALMSDASDIITDIDCAINTSI